MIINHLLKMMLEDDKDTVRKECISCIELNSRTIPFVVTRSLDKSTKVRVEVYRALKCNSPVPFMELNVLDRLQLILNGLNDYEAEAKDACREYIIS